MTTPRPMGARIAPPPPGAATMPRPTRYQSATQIPEEGSLLLTHPRMSQSRGSCIANTTVAGLAAMSGVPLRLSISAAYYDCRRYSGFPAHEDSGCYPEASMRALSEVGVGSISLHPDDWDTGWTKSPDLAYYQQAADHRVLGHYRALDIPSFELAIASGFAVMVCLEVTDTFDIAANDGVMRLPGRSSLGGHAMLGFAYSRTRQQIYLLQSWGEWGMDAPGNAHMGRCALAVPYDWFPYQARIYDSIAVSSFDLEAGA